MRMIAAFIYLAGAVLAGLFGLVGLVIWSVAHPLDDEWEAP
jgi:hypothetical protein